MITVELNECEAGSRENPCLSQTLVSPIPAFLDTPTACLSHRTSFLCASNLPHSQNGHPIRQGQPPINSASRLLNSKHP